MENPATLLLGLFQRWDSEQGNVAASSVRGLVASGELSDADVDHINAMQWISQLRREVDELEQQGRRVGSYRRHLGNWTHIVLNYPGAWQSRHNRDLITAPMLDTLEQLSDVLDAALAPITEEARSSARQLLGQVVDLLTEDSSLPEDVRQYVYQIVTNARNCIEDYEVLGNTDLRAALQHLWGALKAAEGHSSGNFRQRWKSMSERIFAPAAAAMLGTAPTLALQAIQITQGGA